MNSPKLRLSRRHGHTTQSVRKSPVLGVELLEARDLLSGGALSELFYGPVLPPDWGTDASPVRSRGVQVSRVSFGPELPSAWGSAAVSPVAVGATGLGTDSPEDSRVTDPVVIREPARSDTENTTREYTRTEILVGVRATDDPLAAFRELAANAGDGQRMIDTDACVVLLTDPAGVSVVQVGLLEGADPHAAVELFAAQPWAEYAQPNYVVRDGLGKDWTPNDPQYTAAGQYFHTKSQTNLAWDLTKGDPSIVVGVADDGLGYNHPDLVANIWANPGEVAGNGIDDDGNGKIDDVRGWDFNANDNAPLPDGADSHGTHVGGIIAARSNNGVGVAGTAGGDGSNPATGVRLAGLRWDGPAGWTSAMVTNAYAYAGDNGIKIVNASYNFDFWVSGGVPDPVVNTALNYALGKGVLIMNSAGNNGTLGSPRSVFTQPLFVSSVNSSDVRSSFSNYGAYVDVAGHGDGILSTTTNTSGTGVNYEVYSGTSMSTPHAAGVAALIWSMNPTWTRDQVAAQLIGTGDNIDAISGNVPGTLGPRVNANRALTQTLAAPVFTNLTLNTSGTGQVSSVTVTTPRRLLPASVVPANFQLISDGADNVFGTADDVSFTPVINGGAAYTIGTNSLTITQSGGLPLPVDRYRLTALSGASLLRDPFNTPLDGDGNGTGGDNYVTVFGANPQITGTVFEDWNGNGSRNTNDPGVAGRTVYLDANGNGSFDSTSSPFTNSTPLAIPDTNTPVTSSISVTGLSGTIADVDVKVNVTHTWDEDLDAFLIAPDGTRVELFTDVGGSGDNFTNTVLDDEAATPITSGTAPFTGSFRPEGLLSVLDGKVPNGTWKLEFTDDEAPDAGTLQNWTITITTAEPAATTDANGAYAFTNVANGTYTVRQVTPSGWVSTGAASHSVSITGPSSTFSGRDFGSGRNDRFYGFVWNDADADGVIDGGEPAVAGRTVFVDLNGNGTLDSGAASPFTNSTALAIPDTNTPVTSSISVTGLSGAIADVNVKVNVTHAYVSDLDAFLIAPDGTRVELFTDVGGSGDNFTNTVLDDEAATPITSGTAPFTGSFRPEGLLSVLDGKVPNGTWKLEFTDDEAPDAGTLQNWTITITTAEPSATTAATGNVSFDLAAGANNVRLAPLAGWNYTVPATGLLAVTAAGAPLFNRNFGTASATAPPTLSAVQMNGTTAPSGAVTLSRVTSLVLNFSTAVNIAPGTFSLTNGTSTITSAAGGGISVAGGGTNTITLTFTGSSGVDFGSLADGIWTLSTNMTQVTAVSGGTPGTGTTTTSNIRRLYGDIDGNGVVNSDDFDQFGNTFGLGLGEPGYLAGFDFDNNGVINSDDFDQFGNRFGVSL